VEGSNSRLFHILSRVYFRFRLVMLIREMARSRRHSVRLRIRVGNLLPPGVYSAHGSSRTVTAYLRMRTYLLAVAKGGESADPPSLPLLPVMAEVDREILRAEVEGLPADQLLLSYREFDVYHALQREIPTGVLEIGRLRELTFREVLEGNGTPCDTDDYDATYTQLFIWDRVNHEIIGAYRMGRTDVLLAGGDVSALYLSQLFDLTAGFMDRVSPALEMGRSFIVPAHQRSPYGLLLLWRGIGEFLLRFPHYRCLYGTVSLSRIYTPASMAVMVEGLVRPGEPVRPWRPISLPLHPEIRDYLRRRRPDLKLPDLKGLSEMVRELEPDGKDLPILIKQYARLGARFVSVARDEGFSATPGVLLVVDIPRAPHRALKLYMGDRYTEYLAHHGQAYPRPVGS